MNRKTDNKDHRWKNPPCFLWNPLSNYDAEALNGGLSRDDSSLPREPKTIDDPDDPSEFAFVYTQGVIF